MIVVYKARYRLFSEFVADVVATINQECKYVIYFCNLDVYFIRILIFLQK